MSAHSKGPWSAHGPDGWCTIRAADGAPVATLITSHADAVLMAAAPRMLAALMMVASISFGDDQHDPSDEEVKIALRAVCAAIKTAHGDAP